MQTSSQFTQLLDRFPHLRSRSAEEAIAMVGRVFAPHQLAMPGKDRLLDLRHNRIRLNQLGINVLTYGVPVEIDQVERGDFYMLLHPLRGQTTVDCGGRSVVLDVGTMGVLLPRQPTRMHWSGDCEMLLLEVPRAMLEDIVGPPLVLRSPAVLALSRTYRPVAAWWQSLLDVTNGLHQYGDCWLSHPRMQLAIEEFLVAGLYTLFSDHGASQTAVGGLSATSQRALQKAIDYIHAHARERLTVADIASAACVSPRTLEVAFRRRHNQSPLGYVRGVQLDRVHETLRVAGSTKRPVQVSDVAKANGFTHMGRFAGYYKQRFGISPTLTLRGSGHSRSLETGGKRLFVQQPLEAV